MWNKFQNQINAECTTSTVDKEFLFPNKTDKLPTEATTIDTKSYENAQERIFHKPFDANKRFDIYYQTADGNWYSRKQVETAFAISTGKVYVPDNTEIDTAFTKWLNKKFFYKVMVSSSNVNKLNWMQIIGDGSNKEQVTLAIKIYSVQNHCDFKTASHIINTYLMGRNNAMNGTISQYDNHPKHFNNARNNNYHRNNYSNNYRRNNNYHQNNRYHNFPHGRDTVQAPSERFNEPVSTNPAPINPNSNIATVTKTEKVNVIPTYVVPIVAEKSTENKED